MLQYTEWCPYCDAETDYDLEWTHIKCSGCGRWLMPCDWCICAQISKSSWGVSLCSVPTLPGYRCQIEADPRFKCKRKITKQKKG